MDSIFNTNNLKLIESSKTTLRKNVSLGLVLASAMAWNTVVTEFASRFVNTSGKNHIAQLMFALAITILMVIYAATIGNDDKVDLKKLL